MKIIKINLKKIDQRIIKITAEALKNGKVVAMPFDTCYGLAADATNKKAVEKVYKIKKRPKSKPFSIVIKDLTMISKFLKNPDKSSKIVAYAQKLLPGNYTLILPVKKLPAEKIKLYTIFNKTLSIRIPDFPLTQALSSKLNVPFTATSANISNEPPAWSGEEVVKIFQKQKFQPDLVLDAGKLPQKPLSTIIDLVSSKIIER